MFFAFLNLKLTILVLPLLTTLTSSTPTDTATYFPSNSTAILVHTSNINFSSAAVVDTTKWVITYCNKPFDSVTGACRGDCHTWKVAERGLDGPGDTPDTNCVTTYPPFQVQFKVCAGATGAWHCHWDSAFHPWLYPDNDPHGVSVYNTISTGSISLGPDLTGQNT